MYFRNYESLRKSVILVTASVILVGGMFVLFDSRIPGFIAVILLLAGWEFERSRCSRAMYKIIYVDELTGLPNMEEMEVVIEDKIKKGEAFFLAIFDIKNFKIINDLWGYEKGDRHLKFVGDTLKQFSDVFEFACRCENDNFAVILQNSSIAMGMDALHTLFDEIGYLPDNVNYHVRYSCGLVRHEDNYENAHAMFDCAKIAKSIAKQDTQNRIIVYDEKTKAEMIRRQTLKDNLLAGLDNDEFLVYLQPKYNLEDDSLAGAEALIRWNYKNERFLPPGEFVPVFEEDGSIGLVDQFVLAKVSEKFEEWQEMGYPLLPISVNVSRVQLTNRNLVKDIAAAVSAKNVPFEYIDLELTESAAFDDMNYLLKTMDDIKRVGFRLSMDDFGTGYSSLGLLQRMPLDILKLDKSFVDGYTDESCEKERLMISDIINMAHHLGITVLAEGVETKLQRDMLKVAGCEIVQGYYYSKPIPIADYEKLLQQQIQENVG